MMIKLFVSEIFLFSVMFDVFCVLLSGRLLGTSLDTGISQVLSPQV